MINVPTPSWIAGPPAQTHTRCASCGIVQLVEDVWLCQHLNPWGERCLRDCCIDCTHAEASSALEACDLHLDHRAVALKAVRDRYERALRQIMQLSSDSSTRATAKHALDLSDLHPKEQV